MMKYKWLLFDADRTLFDYDKAEAVALENAFRQMDLAFDPVFLTEYNRINQQIWSEFEQDLISQDLLKIERFERLFSAIGVQTDPEAFSRQYLTGLSTGSDLIAGAEETIKALFGKVGLVMITNGLKEVQQPRLDHSAIGSYFSDLVISDEIGSSKPDKKIFDVAFSRMNHPKKKEVLIIGDSLTSDIKGGSDYGIDTCWYNPHQDPCTLDVNVTYDIAALSDLLTLIDAG